MTPSLPPPRAHPASDSNPHPAAPPWLAIVAREIKSLRFGVVQITVHDARVVQIERTERTRFDTNA